MFSLWRKARRENSAASRLLGSTSLRFALHGWQRRSVVWRCRMTASITTVLPEWNTTSAVNIVKASSRQTLRGS
ncbi:hypothetical protein [Thiolapillus sp.]|uniref:hypothetical protein n=1 Tax=Thiolapillus sp. TaxID=2017437 RepID=UPI0025E27D65